MEIKIPIVASQQGGICEAKLRVEWVGVCISMAGIFSPQACRNCSRAASASTEG